MILQKYEMFLKWLNLFTTAQVYSMRGKECWESAEEAEAEGLKETVILVALEVLDVLKELEALSRPVVLDGSSISRYLLDEVRPMGSSRMAQK